jgi:hypothetical protein
MRSTSGGESFDVRMKLLNQNYFKLKSTCKSLKKLFEDDQFQANHTVLPRKYYYDTVEWRRPHVSASPGYSFVFFLVIMIFFLLIGNKSRAETILW